MPRTKFPEPKKKESKRCGPPFTALPKHRPMGGHLYMPPVSCDNPRKFENSDGGRWIDVNVCYMCKEKCKRYLEYKKTWKKRF